MIKLRRLFLLSLIGIKVSSPPSHGTEGASNTISGKSENVEIQGKLISQKAEQGYCLLDKLISVNDVTETVDEISESEIVKWTISIRKLEGEVGLGITKWPLVNMSDEMSDNMTETLWNRDAFGESTIMYYCRTGYIFGGSSNKRTSNILVRLGDNITFRFDPIQRTLYLQKVRYISL